MNYIAVQKSKTNKDAIGNIDTVFGKVEILATYHVTDDPDTLLGFICDGTCGILNIPVEFCNLNSVFYYD